MSVEILFSILAFCFLFFFLFKDTNKKKNMEEELSDKAKQKRDEQKRAIELSKTPNLSQEFIIENAESLISSWICQYQVLTEDTIEKLYKKNKDKINWICVAKYQVLSLEFVRRYISKLDIELLIRYQSSCNGRYQELNQLKNQTREMFYKD